VRVDAVIGEAEKLAVEEETARVDRCAARRRSVSIAILLGSVEVVEFQWCGGPEAKHPNTQMIEMDIYRVIAFTQRLRARVHRPLRIVSPRLKAVHRT
jgi:hypothetical protein